MKKSKLFKALAEIILKDTENITPQNAINKSNEKKEKLFMDINEQKKRASRNS